MLETVGQFIAQYWRIPVEIGILAAVLYYIYIYLRGTHGARILIGLALIFLTLTFLSQLFNLAVIGWILRSLSVFLAVALVVIFQPELRRALTDLGSHPFFTSAFEKRETIEELTDTAFEIASKGFGALIAVEREIALKPFIETGVMLDAVYSKELALTIFHPKTVLHDGGLIVHNDRMVAAACIFPLTQREDLDRNLGCAIELLWDYRRNPTPSPSSFPRKPAKFPFATTAFWNAISASINSAGASASFYFIMSLINEILTNDWRPKITCLILASALWYLISKNVEKNPLRFEQGAPPSKVSKPRT